MSVILTAKGIGDRCFDIEHAQRMLDIGIKSPPRTWSLNDPNYTIVAGIITELQPINPNPVTTNINETNIGGNIEPDKGTAE